MPDQTTVEQPKLKMSHVLIAEIEIPKNWNARSGNWEQGKDIETEAGFESFAETIKVQGVRDPIEIRKNPNSANAKQPYSLVCGWRRITAAKKAGFDTIPAINHGEMSEFEARARNGQENVERENLKTPDVAWLIAEAHRADTTKNDTELGIPFGFSQSYISKLRRIMTELPPVIVTEWRNERVKINVADLYKLLAFKDPEKQIAAWKALVGRNEAAEKKDSESAKVEKGKGKWLVGARKRAFEFGYKLGVLAQLKMLSVSKDADWENPIRDGLLIQLGGVPNTKQLASIAEKMGEGYDSGTTAELTDEEEEEEKPKLKVAGKK
jgi:ParB/RepB/Spo0J family partition protein